MQALAQARKGCQILGAGFTEGCETPDRDTGNKTQPL